MLLLSNTDCIALFCYKIGLTSIHGGGGVIALVRHYLLARALQALNDLIISQRVCVSVCVCVSTPLMLNIWVTNSK